MATPYFTLAQFRALTRVKLSRLGVATGQEGSEERLQAMLDRAAAWVEMVTGQSATDKDIAPIPPGMATPENPVSTGVLATLIAQAVQMRTEQVLFQLQHGYVDDASDDVIQTLSVGGFSQTHRTPRKPEERIVNSWESLGDLLWMLMTPDRLEYWLVAIGGSKAVGPAWSYENEVWQPFSAWDYSGFAAAEFGGGWPGSDPLPFDTTGIDP